MLKTTELFSFLPLINISVDVGLLFITKHIIHHIIKNGRYFAWLISIVFFIIFINIIHIIWLINKSFKIFFFFNQGFLLLTLTTHRTAGERRGQFFIPLYHFHPLTNICTWDDYHIFLIVLLVFNRLLLDEIYHLIELLFDWLMMWRLTFVCLFVDLI